jgi:hypothetical protein
MRTCSSWRPEGRVKTTSSLPERRLLMRLGAAAVSGSALSTTAVNCPLCGRRTTCNLPWLSGSHVEFDAEVRRLRRLFAVRELSAKRYLRALAKIVTPERLCKNAVTKLSLAKRP